MRAFSVAGHPGRSAINAKLSDLGGCLCVIAGKDPALPEGIGLDETTGAFSAMCLNTIAPTSDTARSQISKPPQSFQLYTSNRTCTLSDTCRLRLYPTPPQTRYGCCATGMPPSPPHPHYPFLPPRYPCRGGLALAIKLLYQANRARWMQNKVHIQMHMLKCKWGPGGEGGVWG